MYKKKPDLIQEIQAWFKEEDKRKASFKKSIDESAKIVHNFLKELLDGNA